MTHKSLELHVQTTAWTGGIIAAAVGGVLVALNSHDTPSAMLGPLRCLGFALLVALVASAYMQYHAILVLKAQEQNDEADLQKHRRNVKASQAVMFAFLALAVGILVVELFGHKPPPSKTWSVVSSQSPQRESLIVLAQPETSKLRTLTKKDDELAWLVCEVDPTILGRSGTTCGHEGVGSVSSAPRPVFQLMGDPIVFDPAKFTLKYSAGGRSIDLSDRVCAAKHALLAQAAGGVIVVGRHDRRPLSPSAAVEVGSNATLAQLRAESVAQYLSAENECGGSVAPVIRVIAGPAVVQSHEVTSEALTSDRAVEIYGLVAAVSR